MIAMNATDVRKDWSSVLDSVVRHKPVFIRRTRDHMMLCSTDTVSQLVCNVTFAANQYVEDDGSITLSLEALDIISHGDDLSAAKTALVNDILEYAEEYYKEFELYSRAPNRKAHLPYVMKALTAKTPKELEEAVVCQSGKS